MNSILISTKTRRRFSHSLRECCHFISYDCITRALTNCLPFQNQVANDEDKTASHPVLRVQLYRWGYNTVLEAQDHCTHFVHCRYAGMYVLHSFVFSSFKKKCSPQPRYVSRGRLAHSPRRTNPLRSRHCQTDNLLQFVNNYL
jgi:hypothetical protein